MRIFLIIMSTVFCFSGIAYAKCQIQFDSEADRVMHLGGNTLRGNFATPEECDAYWRSRPTFEQNHSKCVGCNEQGSSQTQQNRRSRFKGNNSVDISKPNNYPATEMNKTGGMARRRKNPRAALKAMKKEQQQKQIDEQKEQQSQALFEQGKKEMLLKLKGGSDGGGLALKGNETGLMLKSGHTPTNTQSSVKNDELCQAQQRLTELRSDVKTMQSALRLYQEGLMNNVSSLDQESAEITKRSNDLLYDGVQYISSVASDRFIKSKSKSVFTKAQRKKYEDFIETVDEINDIKEREELIAWLINSPNDTQKLIDGAAMLADNALDNLPIWKHIKINYKAWSSVGKVCVSWLKINDTNRGTEEYSRAVRAISLRMETAVEEINCLKQRMDESTIGCIK